MKSRSAKVKGRYLGLGVVFGIAMGAILQTIVWGAALGVAIGLTWEYLQKK